MLIDTKKINQQFYLIGILVRNKQKKIFKTKIFKIIIHDTIILIGFKIKNKYLLLNSLNAIKIITLSVTTIVHFRDIRSQFKRENKINIAENYR